MANTLTCTRYFLLPTLLPRRNSDMLHVPFHLSADPMPWAHNVFLEVPHSCCLSTYLDSNHPQGPMQSHLLLETFTYQLTSVSSCIDWPFHFTYCFNVSLCRNIAKSFGAWAEFSHSCTHQNAWHKVSSSPENSILVTPPWTETMLGVEGISSIAGSQSLSMVLSLSLGMACRG